MAQIERLAELLKRLNEGEDPAKVKEEAKEFLASVDPTDLSLAEQKLLEAGLAPEDLRRLCAAHMEVLDEQMGGAKTALEPGHVIRTMTEEHERILSFLDELAGINRAIQWMESYDPNRPLFGRLKEVAEHLVGAEPHHQREEQVLFPELEKKGVFGPPQVMRMEHADLRVRKEELKELIERAEEMDFGDFNRRLDAVARFLVQTLGDHIFKENNILYPTALQVIQGDEEWRRLRQECDQIGYCCFTPPAGS